jgi:hypothetical protein
MEGWTAPPRGGGYDPGLSAPCNWPPLLSRIYSGITLARPGISYSALITLARPGISGWKSRPAHACSERLNARLIDALHGQGIQDRRTPEGHAEQAHPGFARDDPGGARRCGRARVSRRASRDEPERLPEPPRQAGADRGHRPAGRPDRGRAHGSRGGAAACLPARPRRARAGWPPARRPLGIVATGAAVGRFL